MAVFEEYLTYDAIGLAELVKRKEISASELCNTAIQRIESYNPLLNAVVTFMYSQVSEQLEGPLEQGIFTGVPMLLKDLLAAYAGAPLTSGSRAFEFYIPDHDSEVVSRLKKTGSLIIGKTNCPEFGLMGVTEPELHGPARNPWNPEHTPGGSSGGSAAAVAAGMVPVATAGDGGGSIRIPAAYCGLFGLKPSRGRVPTGPDYGEIWQGAVSEHVITRTVRDSAAMLDAIQGPDVGAPYSITDPERPYLKEVGKDPGKLRIAFCTESPIQTAVDEECVKAVENTVKLLESLGHYVEEAKPDLDGIALAKSYTMMYCGEMAADLKAIPDLIGRRLNALDVELETKTLAVLGNACTAGEFVTAMREWGKASRIMGAFHEKYDTYVTPTTASLPARIGELKPRAHEELIMKLVNSLKMGKILKSSGLIDQLAIDSLRRTPFTQLANFTGQPAMSVPLHWSSKGFPCGVQFIGRFGDEATLFRLAGQLEKALPWFDMRPKL